MKRLDAVLVLLILVCFVVLILLPEPHAKLETDVVSDSSYDIYIGTGGIDEVENHFGDPLTAAPVKMCNLNDDGLKTKVKCIKVPSDYYGHMWQIPAEY